MAIFSMIGLLFCPVLCLMIAAWSYVRSQNAGQEETETAAKDKKRVRIFLIAAAVSLVVFGVLKIIFPFA